MSAVSKSFSISQEDLDNWNVGISQIRDLPNQMTGPDIELGSLINQKRCDFFLHCVSVHVSDGKISLGEQGEGECDYSAEIGSNELLGDYGLIFPTSNCRKEKKDRTAIAYLLHSKQI